MIIGDRIRKRRVELGYSQKELGEIIKVSKVSICGYETGNRTPNIEKFVDLVNALNVTPSYLLGLDVNVIEDKSDYSIKMSREDIIIIKELKKHPELYNKIVASSGNKCFTIANNLFIVRACEILEELNNIFISLGYTDKKFINRWMDDKVNVVTRECIESDILSKIFHPIF